MATRIPINKETGSGIGFEDRQKRIWEEMETDMERRRREWEEEIEKMRKQFFMLRPEAGGEGGRSVAGVGMAGGGPASMPLGFGERIGPRSRLLDTTSTSADESRGMVVKDDKGNPVFKVLFDVHDYRPEEVSVKMDANKIMVSAHHEASEGGSSVSREYKREVKIPNELDPMTLQCTMGPDGILAVEAPIPAPSYAAVKEATTSTTSSASSRTGSPGLSTGSPRQSSTSSSTSSTSYQTFQPTTRGTPGSSSSLANAAVGAAAGAAAAPQPQSQPQPAEPVLPTGFKPVSAPFLNSAPPPPPHHPSASSLGGSSSGLGPQPGSSSSASSISSSSAYRDTSANPLSAGFSTASPPYQPPSLLSNSSSAQQQQQHATAAHHHQHHSFHSPPIKSVSSSQGGRIGSPVVLSESGKFKLEIDIEDFKPEELTVKTQDKRVVICAKREEKVGNRSSTRELSREYTIPENVDPLTIKAFFTDGGKLIIEAPYRDVSLMS